MQNHEDWGTTLESVTEAEHESTPDEVYWNFQTNGSGAETPFTPDDVGSSFGSESTLIEW